MPSTSFTDPASSDHPTQARSLGFLLREVYGLMQSHVYEAVTAMGHPGLRAVHSPVLRQLSPEGGRVADLARATGLAKQSVTYVVEDLVALGYLRTDPDPEDRRARRISYTPRGQKLLTALAVASREAESGVVAALGLERVQALRGTLEAILLEPWPIDGAKRTAARSKLRRD